MGFSVLIHLFGDGDKNPKAYEEPDHNVVKDGKKLHSYKDLTKIRIH